MPQRRAESGGHPLAPVVAVDGGTHEPRNGHGVEGFPVPVVAVVRGEVETDPVDIPLPPMAPPALPAGCDEQMTRSCGAYTVWNTCRTDSWPSLTRVRVTSIWKPAAPSCGAQLDPATVVVLGGTTA